MTVNPVGHEPWPDPAVTHFEAPDPGEARAGRRRRVVGAVLFAVAASAAAVAFVARGDGSDSPREPDAVAEEAAEAGQAYLKSPERSESSLPSLVRLAHTDIVNAMSAGKLEVSEWTNETGTWASFVHVTPEGTRMRIGVKPDADGRLDPVFERLMIAVDGEDEAVTAEFFSSEYVDAEGANQQIVAISVTGFEPVALDNSGLTRSAAKATDEQGLAYIKQLSRVLEDKGLQGQPEAP